MANIFFHQEKYELAKEVYLKEKEDPESLFYAAICFDRLSQKEEAHLLREKIFTDLDPNPYAEEALFLNCYNQKNSDLLKIKLPKSPYLAFFFMISGEEEFKRNDLYKAKSAFETAIQLLENTIVDRTKKNYFDDLLQKAYLYQSKVHLNLAKKADLKEKSLLLEYGLASLRLSLRHDKGENQERDFLFAEFIKEKDPKKALVWIDKCLKKYQLEAIIKSPYLFKLHKLKGAIAFESIQYENALTAWILAEDAYLPTQLPEEELLDLWLLKAMANSKKGDFESSLNQLAAIINSPVASIKRLEAMLFRQEIFTQMGRQDLAVRHHDTMQLLRKQIYGQMD